MAEGPPDASEASAPPALTAILCVHNGADTIEDQLDALAQQRWDKPWEVLIVDNDSTDATPEIVTAWVERDRRFRVVAARRRRGLSHARNVGVDHARAPAVAFCDDDDLVGEGWVAALGTALETAPIVACRMEYDRLNDSVAMSGRSRFQSKGLEQVFGYEVASGVSGWQREVWEKLGGNDESMTSTGEDFDMSIRAKIELGLEPVFAGDAVYHIRTRAGFRATFRQAQSYGRSHVQLYVRYGRGRIDIRRELRRAVRQWIWLIVQLPRLRSPAERIEWARRAGMRVGRARQSLRSRTLLP
jgi:glycosyltransferase involved in cell wall biosynthesis